MEVPEQLLRRWAEALRGVARTGISFTTSEWEKERYEEILSIAGDIAFAADGNDLARDAGAYANHLPWPDNSYETPKVAVGAIVVNDDDQILLIQRSDSGVWLYPTGWCDVGYSAPEVVVKEVREETGIEVEPVRLIGVLDGMRLGVSHTPLYSLIFLCRAVGGELRPHPLECLDVGWYNLDALPDSTLGSARWAPWVAEAIRGERREVFYDDVRRPVWRGEDAN